MSRSIGLYSAVALLAISTFTVTEAAEMIDTRMEFLEFEAG